MIRKPSKIILDALASKNKPLTIKEIAKLMDISYTAAKSRFLDLENKKLVKRLKRGFYALPNYEVAVIEPNIKNRILINAGVRINPTSNAGNIYIYNKNLVKTCGNQYCTLRSIEDYVIEVRKSDKFNGNKMYSMNEYSIFIAFPRSLMTDTLRNEVSNKSKSIRLIFYPEEWGINIQDLYGTESFFEGQLSKELEKYGKVEKVRKVEDFKADILFVNNGRNFFIELTNAFPKKPGKRSDIKSHQIISRLYYLVKINLKYKNSGILVINKQWERSNWLKKELNFIEKFNGRILFTDFKGNWPVKVAKKIDQISSKTGS